MTTTDPKDAPAADTGIMSRASSGNDDVLSQFAEIDHVNATLDTNANGNFGAIGLSVYDTQGGVSEQTATGISELDLAAGKYGDTLTLTNSLPAQFAIDGVAPPAPAVGDVTRKIVIDGGGAPSGYGNKLYAEDYTAKTPTTETVLATKLMSTGLGESLVASNATETFTGTVFNGDRLAGTGLVLEDFQILYASDGPGQDDYISGATDFKNIYLGNGNNVIDNLSGGVLPG